MFYHQRCHHHFYLSFSTDQDLQQQINHHPFSKRRRPHLSLHHENRQPLIAIDQQRHHHLYPSNDKHFLFLRSCLSSHANYRHSGLSAFFFFHCFPAKEPYL